MIFNLIYQREYMQLRGEQNSLLHITTVSELLSLHRNDCLHLDENLLFSTTINRANVFSTSGVQKSVLFDRSSLSIPGNRLSSVCSA